jgi:putative solute:sodium symporter small subunit
VASGQNNRLHAYWRANNRLIAILLIVWGIVGLGAGIFFVVPLNRVTFFGLPLGFWIAQQGAIYVFVILIFVYAKLMDRIDHKYHLDEEPAPDEDA